jgi:hypothetical protein
VAGFLETVGSEPPSRMFGIRSGSSLSYTIVERSSNTTLETIEASRAFLRVYEGAVYLHEGCTFVVTEVRSSVWVPRTAVQPDLMSRWASTLRLHSSTCTRGLRGWSAVQSTTTRSRATTPGVRHAVLGAVWATQGSPSVV